MSLVRISGTALACLLFLTTACEPIPTEPAPVPHEDVKASKVKAKPKSTPPKVSKTPPTALPSSPSQTLKPLAPGEVGNMLRLQDVQETLKIKEAWESAVLQGISPSKTYDSARWRPSSDKSHHGVAYQLWKEGQPRAKQRLERNLLQYKDAKPTTVQGLRGFLSTQSKILHLGWLSKDGHSVHVLSCDLRICDQKSLKSLASRIITPTPAP